MGDVSLLLIANKFLDSNKYDAGNDSFYAVAMGFITSHDNSCTAQLELL